MTDENRPTTKLFIQATNPFVKLGLSFCGIRRPDEECREIAIKSRARQACPFINLSGDGHSVDRIL